MKDERLQKEMNIIYSELARIILAFAVASYLVKSIILQKGLSECILEYVILIGTPVYIQIRSRWRGVSFFTKRLTMKKKIVVIVVSSLIVLAAAIGKAVLGKEAVDWIQLGWFMVSYLAAFILAFLTIQKIEERRAKKIEEKYDDDDK